MRFFVVLFAIIAAAFAAPQFGGGFGGSGQITNDKISDYTIKELNMLRNKC